MHICNVQSNMTPTQIIILGGTGDLSKRKLLPALLDLYARGMLPETFNVIGMARSDWTDGKYKEFVTETIEQYHDGHGHDREVVEKFCERLSYVQGSFDDITSYNRLGDAIDAFDKTHDVRANRLFYLAVAPRFYEQIFTDLVETGVGEESNSAWTHILVEKPFGHNLETAKQLDEQLASLYKEEQIFRIDHYLAKEAVQNILSFRFANNLLKTPWNNHAIESVHITMTETIDVGNRPGFYEGVGALRDVGQNHLLQLLALVAMQEPTEFTPEKIHAERTKILQALKPVQPADVVRAQYEGYVASDDIPDDSQTETYFELKAELDVPEWAGVPFYIRAGKALDQAEVSVRIKLRDVATGMFETSSCESAGNEILLTVQPEQRMSITLNAKKPGLGFQLEQRTMSVNCDCAKDEIKNSYEKVLYDAITADQTLFTTTEEVLAAWAFVSPIIESWGNTPLQTYAKGSRGPADSIIPNH